MSHRPALLVINIHSRRGAGATEVATRVLQEAGVPVLIRDGAHIGDLSDQICEACGQVGSVIIGGGDGTINAAARGLFETGLPLGVIPLGTANDLARTLDIPLDLGAAARIIAARKVHRVDLGEVNGHLFFNVAGIDFGVDLTRALTRASKRHFGPLGYAIAGLRAMSRLRSFRAEIIHGPVTYISRTVHVAVGNGRHYGGGMTVAENACIDDGRLNIYSLEVDTFWRLLRLMPALRRGRHEIWEEIRALEGETIEVRTPGRPRSVSVDGEIVTQTPAHFRVLRSAVGVFVP